MASLYFERGVDLHRRFLIADVHLYGDAPKLCKFRPFVIAQREVDINGRRTKSFFRRSGEALQPFSRFCGDGEGAGGDVGAVRIAFVIYVHNGAAAAQVGEDTFRCGGVSVGIRIGRIL